MNVYVTPDRTIIFASLDKLNSLKSKSDNSMSSTLDNTFNIVEYGVFISNTSLVNELIETATIPYEFVSVVSAKAISIPAYISTLSRVRPSTEIDVVWTKLIKSSLIVESMIFKLSMTKSLFGSIRTNAPICYFCLARSVASHDDSV